MKILQQLAVMSILTLGYASIANCASILRTVALTDLPAPDTPLGVRFDTFAPPVINSRGQTAFIANLKGTGVTKDNANGVWSEGFGTFHLVARSGLQAVGTNGLTFEIPAPKVLSNVYISSSGQTAFSAQLVEAKRPGHSRNGHWREDRDSLSILSRIGDYLPSVSDSNYLGGLKMDASGQAIFSTFSSNPAIRDSSIWWVGSDEPELVVRTGDPVPGITADATFISLGSAALSNRRQIAFWAPFQGDGISWENRTAIFATTEDDSLRLVVQDGSSAPGTTEGTTFYMLNGGVVPAVNAGGTIAFYASLAGDDIDSTNDRGLWYESNGSLSIVVRKGDQAPDMPSEHVMHNILPSWTAFSDKGHFSLLAEVSGATVTGSNNEAIFAGKPGSLQLIAREGDATPGLLPEFKLKSLGVPTVNSFGQVAFDSSVDISGTDLRGIWATDRSGILRLLVMEGDQLEVMPGVFKTISTTGLYSGVDTRLSQSSFNDRGQLVFIARFVDGTEGIFVSNAVAVPESGNLLIMSSMIIGVSLMRRAVREVRGVRREQCQQMMPM